MLVISIAKDFTSRPGGRTKVMGPGSGEAFRDLLVRHLKRLPEETIEVELDGTEGYGSSFLEEAFGGIIRNRLLPAEDALRRIIVVARTPAYRSYAGEARQYMLDAAREHDATTRR